MTYWRPYNKTIYFNPTAYSFQTTRSKQNSNQVYINPKLLDQYFNFMIKNKYKPLMDLIEFSVDKAVKEAEDIFEKRYQISTITCTIQNSDVPTSDFYESSIFKYGSNDGNIYKYELIGDDTGFPFYTFTDHHFCPFWWYVKAYSYPAPTTLIYYGFWPICCTIPESYHSFPIYWKKLTPLIQPPYNLTALNNDVIILRSTSSFNPDEFGLAIDYNYSATSISNFYNKGPFTTDSTFSDLKVTFDSTEDDIHRSTVIYEPIFIQRDNLNQDILKMIEGPPQSSKIIEEEPIIEN